MLELDVHKEIIYYTDNRLTGPIVPLARKYILASGLRIVSSSLRPIRFGDNEVVAGARSYPTMIKQILSCLRRSTAKYVFFCEHDVLYHRTHFEFVPKRDDVFYYNSNVWRWWLGSDKAIRYDRMLPLSCLCCSRELALEHYKLRRAKILEWGLDQFRSREPRLARLWGYEPGTKKRKRGGLTDDDYDIWYSEYPNIDIRHKWSFSSPKIALDDFKHKPTNWQETSIEDIDGWNLASLFQLETKSS